MRTESQLLLILGVLLLIGGFFASIYEEYRYGIVLKYPYRDLGIILIVLGVVLIIAAAFLSILRKQEKEEQKFIPKGTLTYAVSFLKTSVKRELHVRSWKASTKARE